ncbi:hypothetical protein pb186bvf_009237 [Paramecium bursaria]
MMCKFKNKIEDQKYKKSVAKTYRRLFSQGLKNINLLKIYQGILLEVTKYLFNKCPNQQGIQIQIIFFRIKEIQGIKL